MLNYKPVYYDTQACLWNEVNEKLKLISNNTSDRYCLIKKTKIIYNDFNYIKTGISSLDCYNFTNISEYQKAIEDNE